MTVPLAELIGHSENLSALNDALIYGSPVLTLPTPTGMLAGIMISDCCDVFGPATSAQAILCNSFDEGVLSTGINAVMLRYADQLDETIALFNATLGNGASSHNQTLAALTDPQFQWLVDFDQLFLPTLINNASTVYRTLSLNQMAAWDNSQRVAIAAFVIVAFYLYIWYYEPLLKEMNAENRRMAAMLLMLPRNVLLALPGIGKRLDDMLITSSGSADIKSSDT
jgi:hypothetical protein